MIKWLTVLLFVTHTVDPGDIRRINNAKNEAKKAYLAGDYTKAIEKYRYLIDSIGIDEDEVRMNLANAYFQLNDTTQAYSSYLPLTQSKNQRLQSVAYQQMGVLNNRQGKTEEALANFKQALKANPGNEDARFNYEILKKKLEEKKNQDQQNQKDKQQEDQKKDQKDQQDQNKDQQKKDEQQKKDQEKKDQEKKDQEKKDQENKDQKDKEQQDKQKQEKEKQQKEQEQKEQEQKDKDQLPPSVKDKLKNMNMSEEKAKMILEAMKNQEVQYLQQNKRKATKPKDKGKPDW